MTKTSLIAALCEEIGGTRYLISKIGHPISELFGADYTKVCGETCDSLDYLVSDHILEDQADMVISIPDEELGVKLYFFYPMV